MTRITHYASERAAWIACAVACAFAAFLLMHFRIAIEPYSFAVASGVMAFLGGGYLIYRVTRPDPALSNLCGALAAITLSGAAAGIISLIGLRFGAPLIDEHLAAFDHALGISTPNIVRASAAWPRWSALLGIAYDSSFPLLCCVAIVLTLARRYEQLWKLAFVFAATIIACTTISVLLPARGAFAHFAYGADLLDALPHGAGLYHLPKFDYYRNDSAPVIAFSSLSGVVTFPSFHTALALATIAACAGIRWLFLPSLFWNALVIYSTIPVGGHYAIDLPVGAALWCVSSFYAGVFTRNKFAPADGRAQDLMQPASK